MSQSSLSESVIFKAAIQLLPEQRGAYLDRACGENRPLRDEVDSLLEAHDPQGSFLKGPAPALTIDRAISEGPGTIVGPYKLIQLIGEGGMGVVYMAQQTEPVKRLVALKIIKPGMDSRQVIARFEAERQALALMDHPNIAKVLDAGTTDSGLPFFVMELVKGIPITAYCDEKRLTPRERLELFVPVCHAVQHAHQKGIIHRDLKPSNVMIALYDGRPVPKVIDFGVAKAAGGQLTEKTLVTSFGSLVGTLEYMSPEQAELNQLDVDTRSDIYALGVLLYELLTGGTPLDGRRLRSAAFDEMLRIIREEEPPLPSTRLSSVGAAHDQRARGAMVGTAHPTLISIAAVRSIDPARLAGIIRGEIDWIVMKALEKDRSRRYETANGLARDIQRYLADESVEACPPSIGYRMSKISRRYRVPLTIAAGFAALLIVGTAVSAWQALRATTAERQAVASEQKALQAAAAERGAKEAEASERRRAVANEQTAKDNEQTAQQERDSADREKNNAIAAREELRETLYASEMNQVQSAAENQQVSRAAQLLDLQRPAAGQKDFRGFEWHYWQRKLHGNRRRSIEIPGLGSPNSGFVGSRQFSQNSLRLAVLLETSGSTSSPQYRELSLLDGVTGRELLPPFDPFADLPETSNRNVRFVVSANGARLAVASSARGSGGQLTHISIREGNSGKEIHRIVRPMGVSQFALTADGSRLALEHVELLDPSSPRVSLGQAGITIWDTSTGQQVQSLPMIPKHWRYDRILWLPDGTRLLRSSVTTESRDNKERFGQRLQVVDVTSGTELWLREFSDLSFPLTAWSWSPHGKLIALADHIPPAKPTVQLWDSQTGATVAVLERDAPSAIMPETLDISPDGQRLAAASNANEIWVWELPPLPLAGAAEPQRIAKPNLTLYTERQTCALAFSADGRELTAVDRGNSVVTWDVSARDGMGTGPDWPDWSIRAAISPDTTKVAFLAFSATRRIGPRNVLATSFGLWDLVKNQEVLRLDGGGAFIRPDFSLDGRRLMFHRHTSHDLAERQSQISIYDTETAQALLTIPVQGTDPSSQAVVLDQGFRPDGGQFAAIVREVGNERPARLNAWDAANGALLFSVEIGFEIPGGVHYSRDGASLIVGSAGAPTVYYDAATGKQQKSIPLDTEPRRLFVDPHHQVFGASHGSDFILFDLETGQERLRLPGYNDVNPNSFAISPDGSRLALGRNSPGADEITIWSMKSGRRLLSLHREGEVDAMSFSPDGNRLIVTFGKDQSRGEDSTAKPIQIWDATPLPEEP